MRGAAVSDWHTERDNLRAWMTEEREAHLAAAFAGAETIVVAWGAHALGEIAARRVLALIPEGARVVCLGKTRSGAPRHPLYLASSTQPEAFEVPRDR